MENPLLAKEEEEDVEYAWCMLCIRGAWETRGTSLPQLFHYFLYRK